MGAGSLITIIIVIVITIVALYFIYSTIHSLGHKTTTTTIPQRVNGTTTTTSIPAVVQFTSVNDQYVYSGPSRVGNTTCSYSSHTSIDYTSKTLNGSQSFYLQYTISSSQCPMTITGVSVNTPGFAVTSVIPKTPFTLPPYSQANFQFDMKAPNSNFYGPLTITIDYN